jgi:hypothetical protein
VVRIDPPHRRSGLRRLVARSDLRVDLAHGLRRLVAHTDLRLGPAHGLPRLVTRTDLRVGPAREGLRRLAARSIAPRLDLSRRTCPLGHISRNGADSQLAGLRRNWFGPRRRADSGRSSQRAALGGLPRLRTCLFGPVLDASERELDPAQQAHAAPCSRSRSACRIASASARRLSRAANSGP